MPLIIVNVAFIVLSMLSGLIPLGLRAQLDSLLTCQGMPKSVEADQETWDMKCGTILGGTILEVAQYEFDVTVNVTGASAITNFRDGRQFTLAAGWPKLLSSNASLSVFYDKGQNYPLEIIVVEPPTEQGGFAAPLGLIRNVNLSYDSSYTFYSYKNSYKTTWCSIKIAAWSGTVTVTT